MTIWVQETYVKDLKRFRVKGGHAESFFPSKLPLINLRMNNRNHRKIVVIDGKIGYVGGFNVGDEYLGKSKKFGYWRDAHLRMKAMLSTHYNYALF